MTNSTPSNTSTSFKLLNLFKSNSLINSHNFQSSSGKFSSQASTIEKPPPTYFESTGITDYSETESKRTLDRKLKLRREEFERNELKKLKKELKERVLAASSGCSRT